MGWCPNCDRELQRESSCETEGEWLTDTQGVVSHCLIKNIQAAIEVCLECGFQEPIDFQQKRLCVPVTPPIFLN